MIRLNPASAAKRRTTRRVGHDISDLLGESPRNGTASKTASTTPVADRLFEELLGDNASAIGSTNDVAGGEREDDESSNMSSIFSGLLDKYKRDRKTNGSNENAPQDYLGRITEGQQHDDQIVETDPEEARNETIGEPLKHHEKQPHLSSEQQLQQRRLQLLLKKSDENNNKQQKQAQQQDQDQENEEDTLLTKPREISFDPQQDDVSTLFDVGGVSTLNNRDGVESYMGTYAKQRQNRRKGGGVGFFGGFGARGRKRDVENPQGRAASSYQSESQGVDSILEDIGVRSSAKSDFTEDNDSGDDKGHHSKRHFRSLARRVKQDAAHEQNLVKRVMKASSTTTLVLMVIIMYVLLQIPTVQKNDKLAMKKLKHGLMDRYEKFQNGGNYDDGNGEGHVLRRRGTYEGGNDFNHQEREMHADRGLDGSVRSGSKQSNIIRFDLSRGKKDRLGSVDDMAMLSKRDSGKHPNKPVPDEFDDKKAALLSPPQNVMEEKSVDVDKLNDIDPIKFDPDDSIPSKYRAFASLNTPYVRGRDTPFFWHIPRSGGVIVKTLMSHCLRMTLAAEVGELEGHDQDEELKVVSLFDHNYTNVNVATAEGISRALSLGLVPSHLADVIVSAQVDKIPSLFTSNEHARAFVLLRNPVDRAASMFYFLKSMGNERLKNMTVYDYAKSDMIENNWMVRILSDAMTGSIDAVNLETAQLVLKKKFIVGILENKRGSFARFDHYFKWKENPYYEKEFGCIKQIMDEKYTPKHPMRQGDLSWNLLFEQNRFDMQLYEYAKELFKEQSSYIFGL
ncbi:hypothetical protein ACHAW6_009646 [Cyclotella cf. meneghiniana]